MTTRIATAIGILLAVLGTAIYHTKVTLASSDTSSSDATFDPGIAPQPTVDPNSPEGEIIQELHALVDRWQTPILLSEGWLHVAEQHDRNLADAGELASNQSLPIDYIKEGWYLLDNKGVVLEAVVWMKDQSGVVVQEVAFVKGFWLNRTTDERFEGGSFQLRLDFGFIDNAERGPGWYSSLSRREVSSADGAAVLFVIRDNTGSLEESGSLSSTVSSVETRARFMPETGALQEIEVVAITDSGEEEVLTTVRYLTLESGNPPIEVLRLLEEITNENPN